MIKKEPYKTLEENLSQLLLKSKSGPLKIKEILEVLSGKGKSLILIFLALPFCQPIQIPGLSTPFGLIIAFIGLRLGFGKNIWLPKFLSSKQVSPKIIQKISDTLLVVVKKIKKFIHPRLDWACHSRYMRIINGLAIFLLGIFLALPLPIPLTNLIAAWLIFIMGIGILKDDGLFVLIGLGITLLTFIFFIALGIYFI